MAKFSEKKHPDHSAWVTMKSIGMGVGGFFHGFGSCVYKLRKFLMAVPVLVGLVYLTAMNNAALPQQVGLSLQKDGSFAITVSKEFALIGPVGLTVGCLLLMFASKKTLQPWVVSIFTLALPVLIWLINVFPG